MLYGYLILAALGTIGLAAIIDGGDGGGNFDGDEELGNDTTVTTEDDGTLKIDVGEDENGTLVAVKTVEYDSLQVEYDRLDRLTTVQDQRPLEPVGPDEKIQLNGVSYGLDYYLVPKGVEVPIDPDGSSFDLTDTNNDGDVLDELMTSLGAKQVASLNLGNDDRAFIENGVDTRVEPKVDVNVDYDILTARSYTDAPDALSTITAKTISPFEEIPEYWYDTLVTNVSANALGTTADDWFNVTNNTDKDIIVRGGAGSDKLESESDNVELWGGKDDDYLSATGLNSEANGGEGNDRIYIGDEAGSARGAEGADKIIVVDSTGDSKGEDTLRTVVFGGLGDDTIFNTSAPDEDDPFLGGVDLYGDEGNDYILAGLGDRVFGGSGNDTIDLDKYGAGASVVAGEGDDFVRLEYGTKEEYDFFKDDFFKESGYATVELGAGADTVVLIINHTLTDATQASEPVRVLHVKDFDSKEDVLRLTPINGVSGIADVSSVIPEGEDYTLATVTMKGAAPSAGVAPLPDLKFIIRLDGVSNFTPDMLKYL